MTSEIPIRPISKEAFAPFGDIFSAEGPPDKLINEGLCGRYHDRALLEFTEGRAGISIFKAEPRTLPLELKMVERHPDGSQAFIPMSLDPFLVIVAPDENGKPGTPHAFMTKPGQGVNYHKGVWHGVLSPLHEPGLFAVVDRIGNGLNLEEYCFDAPYLVLSE